MKKIVYDLDGTIIPFNTFKVWICLSFAMSLLALKLVSFTSIAKLIFLRSFSKLNRVEFKEKILILQNNDQFWDKVGNMYASILVLFFVRTNILKYSKQSAFCCLATAAPEVYVKHLSKKLNCFEITLNTTIDDNMRMIEVFGYKKRDLVLSALEQQVDEFYTDHYDDAPLAKKCKKTFFIYPKSYSLGKIKSDDLLFNYEIIK